MTNKKIKILTILVDRANYGRLKPVLTELQVDRRFELSVQCSGSMGLRRFGNTSQIVRDDGFSTLPDVFTDVEGGGLQAMGMSIGLAITVFSTVIKSCAPDFVLIIGDRFEALAAAIATVYSNVRLIHVQGGEISGSLDEMNRHAITKLAHLHFPATENARNIILRMGEDPEYVHNVGCPVGDIILNGNLPSSVDVIKEISSRFTAKSKYAVVVFHSNTANIKKSQQDIVQLMSAMIKLSADPAIDGVIWLWPNIDAGSDELHVHMRGLIKSDRSNRIFFIKNLSPERYQALIKGAFVLVGNSSSFVRDSSFTGCPVVLLGDRQTNRESGANVVRLEDFSEISLLNSIYSAIGSAKRINSGIYGDGTAAKKMLNIIENSNPPFQKVYFSNA